MLRAALGNLPQPKQPLLPVMLDKCCPQHLGQLARSIAARDVHLPQPVLRCDVALREQKVLHVLRANVRHALGVAQHFNRSGNARYRELAINLGQGAHRPRVKPGGKGKQQR